MKCSCTIVLTASFDHTSRLSIWQLNSRLFWMLTIRYFLAASAESRALCQSPLNIRSNGGLNRSSRVRRFRESTGRPDSSEPEGPAAPEEEEDPEALLLLAAAEASRDSNGEKRNKWMELPVISGLIYERGAFKDTCECLSSSSVGGFMEVQEGSFERFKSNQQFLFYHI